MSQTFPTASPRAEVSDLTDALRAPALIVRMSAIGDTLIATRTHAHLHKRGYAPFLLTHKNNASLLQCMPLLAGACLMTESEKTYWLSDAHCKTMRSVNEEEFAQALKRFSPANSPEEKRLLLPVLDLQNTRRSARAIRAFEQRFVSFDFRIEKSAVAKQTLWRILFVFWGFLALRQWSRRIPPAWLQKRLKPVHQLQYELVQKLPEKIHSTSNSLPSPVLIAPTPINCEQPGNHVVFLVGSSFRLKSWPREHYRSLQNLILAHTSLDVYLCGGKEDISVGDYLAFPANERVINSIGKTSLAETLGLIRTARYVVTGDSFASHAADLLGTPVSVIFGSTHPLLGFAPQGSHTSVHHSELSCSPCSRHGQGQCRFKNIRCLTSIKPEEVFSKIMQILEQQRQISDTQRQSSDS